MPVLCSFAGNRSSSIRNELGANAKRCGILDYTVLDILRSEISKAFSHLSKVVESCIDLHRHV